MRKFILAILSVSVFFVGLGALVEKTGAKFKSDDKALALVAKARLAIGGDSALAAVQSMRIVGQTTRNIKIDGIERAETGETEISMQLPDKLMKTIKIGHEGDGTGERMVNKQVDVVMVGSGDAEHKVTVTADGTGEGAGVKKIVIRKADGTEKIYTGAEADKIAAEDAMGGTSGQKHIIIKRADGSVQEINGSDGEKVIIRTAPGAENATPGNHVFMRQIGDHNGMKQNELLRLTLGLLLTAPQGMDVGYTSGGESTVDGTACNIVVAEFAGASYRIFLSQSTNLPVMLSYKGMPMPAIMHFRTKDPNASDKEPKDNMVFTRHADGPSLELVDISVKFSDYRAVNGVQLPYKWTQAGGGDETFDVTSYEINPANIAERFQNQKVMVRTKAPEVQ